MNEEMSPQKLQDTILQVAEAETENFAELVQLAGLNIKQDFAEADLSETNLEGIDLSSANLKDTILRSVNLNRTDLRRAILVNVDLRNATLKNADLRDANLTNANLSESNLTGADLRGANFDFLINTRRSRGPLSRRKKIHFTLVNPSHFSNLNQSHRIADNLSGANVTNTRFGRNFGISKSLRRDLEYRGAIFDDASNKPTYASPRR